MRHFRTLLLLQQLLITQVIKDETLRVQCHGDFKKQINVSLLTEIETYGPVL